MEFEEITIQGETSLSCNLVMDVNAERCFCALYLNSSVSNLFIPIFCIGHESLSGVVEKFYKYSTTQQPIPHSFQFAEDFIFLQRKLFVLTLKLTNQPVNIWNLNTT